MLTVLMCGTACYVVFIYETHLCGPGTGGARGCDVSRRGQQQSFALKLEKKVGTARGGTSTFLISGFGKKERSKSKKLRRKLPDRVAEWLANEVFFDYSNDDNNNKAVDDIAQGAPPPLKTSKPLGARHWRTKLRNEIRQMAPVKLEDLEDGSGGGLQTPLGHSLYSSISYDETESEDLVGEEDKKDERLLNGTGQSLKIRRLPQALIVGVKKGGTRALLEFLRLHPDVRAVGPETHFFDRHYDKGLNWYRDQMPPTFENQLTMEKTPSYFVTREVPRRIFFMSRDIKLLVVVRDPVTRAISDYTQTVSKRRHMKAFDELCFLNNSSGLVDTSWGAIRIGVYAKHLERWLRFFPRNQLHFVSGERLIKDPAGEMALVQDFLGLRRVISEKHFYFNETKGFPCLKKSDSNSSPRCLGKTKGRVHPSVDNSTVLRLREFFRPFNLKFYHMTGRNFAWP